MKSLAEVLSDDNRALLQVIREVNPESISALGGVRKLLLQLCAQLARLLVDSIA
ncbi:MAG: hypothetical protein LC647_07305 [Beggiatoa sp.]|nr:hypothetical protein [Beggiatoa sp.]